MKDPREFLDALAAAAARRAGPLGKLDRDLRRLHEGFAGARGSRHPDYLRSDFARRAYTASYTVPNAARALLALRRARAGLGKGERALDVGSGTGATALALASLSHPDSEIVLADRSGDALGEAERMFRALFPDGPRIRLAQIDLREPRKLDPGPFRTVMAGHVLNELLPRRGRGAGDALDLARALSRRTSKDGALILIEPAQRIPSRALGQVRQSLIRSGFLPLAPCTHAGACPVLGPRARDWCVIDVPFRRPKLIEEVDGRVGINRTRLTVSYLAVSRAAKPAGGRSVEVLSEPMPAKGGCVIYLCGEGGRLAATLPKPPSPRPYRGWTLRLPEDAKPEGRDRSGAPRVPLRPDSFRG